MVNIKVPLNPVQKRGLWPPKGAREYPVLDTDDWWKVAAREHLDVWALIEFNFQTHVPEEVNWYLRELVGCRHSKDGRNYTFFGADPKKRKIYLPVTPPPPPPPPPAPIPWYVQIKKLRYEVEHSTDPQRDRFLCMLDAMENRRDDRVIFWPDIAPDNSVVAPFFIERGGLIDQQWLYDHIKTWEDVAALPYGNGFPRADTFVVSFHKYLFEGLGKPGSVFYLRAGNEMIVKTHDMLDKWANVGVGGSSSMPVAYQAIRTFVRLGENSSGSVVNCIVTTGTK